MHRASACYNAHALPPAPDLDARSVVTSRAGPHLLRFWRQPATRRQRQTKRIIAPSLARRLLSREPISRGRTAYHSRARGAVCAGSMASDAARGAGYHAPLARPASPRIAHLRRRTGWRLQTHSHRPMISTRLTPPRWRQEITIRRRSQRQSGRRASPQSGILGRRPLRRSSSQAMSQRRRPAGR
jgi:hypothetical protein